MKFILGLTFFILFYNFTFSQSQIIVKDTTIERAIINKIPIYGEISERNGSDYKFCFEFNSLVIDIKNIVADESCLFSNINSYKVDYNNFNKSILNIECSLINNNNSSNILFYMQVEGLAGSDTSTIINPLCYNVDNKQMDNITFTSGIINVNSTPIVIKYIEKLSYNSPNPFKEQTTLTFTIADSTNVSFQMFTMNGREVFNSNVEENDFEYTVFDSKNNLISNPISHIYERGLYKLVLNVLNWRLSAGAYYLVMTTAKSNYKTNLMLIK